MSRQPTQQDQDILTVANALYDYRSSLLQEALVIFSPATEEVLAAVGRLGQSRVPLTPAARHDLQLLWNIGGAQANKAQADREYSYARSEHSEKNRLLESNESLLRAEQRKVSDNFAAAREKILRLRQPYEATIEKKRQALADAEFASRDAGDELYNLNPIIERHNSEGVSHQEQYDKYVGQKQALDIQVETLDRHYQSLQSRFNAQPTRAPSLEPLVVEDSRQKSRAKGRARVVVIEDEQPVRQIDVDRAKRDLQLAQSKLREVSRNLEEVSLHVKQHAPIAVALQKQQKQLQSTVAKQEKEAEQTSDWLAINDIELQGRPEDIPPGHLDVLIRQCEQLLELRTQNLSSKISYKLSIGKAAYLDYNVETLEALLVDLRALKTAMHQVDQYSRADRSNQIATATHASSVREKRAAVDSFAREVESNLQNLNRALVQRELQQEDLIPEKNIFTENLGEFQRVLDDLLALKNEDPELTGRIDEIERNYNQFYQQYARDLAAVSKPYKVGWHGKEDYHAAVVMARQRLVVKLQNLVNPASNANKHLRAHPAVFSRLSRLHQLATVLAVLTGVGAIYTGYRIFKHVQARKIEKAFQTLLQQPISSMSRR